MQNTTGKKGRDRMDRMEGNEDGMGRICVTDGKVVGQGERDGGRRREKGRKSPVGAHRLPLIRNKWKRGIGWTIIIHT